MSPELVSLLADHVLPLGARLKCVLGTDLGHYSPTAMSRMLRGSSGG